MQTPITHSFQPPEGKFMPATENSQRVTARIAPKVYETLLQAAELSGATMNQFIIQSAFEKAKELIENEHFIRMTTRSAAAFFNAIENPPRPTSKLKKAAAKYKKLENASEN
jgi:uncharacterized protein (DUF1778 family)